jgi:hypothetical protein
MASLDGIAIPVVVVAEYNSTSANFKKSKRRASTCVIYESETTNEFFLAGTTQKPQLLASGKLTSNRNFVVHTTETREMNREWTNSLIIIMK